MQGKRKTAIVTGASQGIGEAIVQEFLAHDYQVVANSRNVTASASLKPSESLVLVDGNIGEPMTTKKIVEVALTAFGSIDALVNNAGIFFSKPFTDYTDDDYKALSNVNVEGFLYLTQAAVKQMLAQNRGGSVVSITASRVVNPIAGSPSSVPMITKGGLEAATRSLAVEYAKQHIRFNAVAPGIVDTPMHGEITREVIEKMSPMGTIASASDIAMAVLYLTEARSVTGEVLHVDGGAHVGKW